MVVSKLHGAILRNLVFPIGDWWRGIPIGNALRFLEESQWWPAEKIRDLQNAKLRKLIADAYENVPYYRKIMDERGLKPSDIETTEDLVKLPVLTSDAIRENYPDGLRNHRLSSRDMSMYWTSGSTGQPKHYFNSKSTVAFGRASYYRFFSWCGGRRGDPLYAVWGQSIVGGRWGLFVTKAKVRLVTREILLNAWDITPDHIRKFVKRMPKEGVILLRGYPSELARFAQFVKTEGIHVPPIKSLSTTAEQLSPSDRKIIEGVFDAPIFDQYGCGECNGMAYECDKHVGLHIAAEHCIIEIVDDNGTRLPPGQTGKIAMTNLENEAFPFIRYLNGDEAALLPDMCPCGRGLPLMSPIAGRSRDVLYGLNGRKFWGGFFTLLVMQLGWIDTFKIRGYQFVQTGPDRLRFDLASEKEPPAEELEKMFQYVRDYLGPMQLEYRKVDQIDRGQSNKRRYTIREWHPDQA